MRVYKGYLPVGKPGVRLLDSENSGVIVQEVVNSSLSAEVKEK